MSHSHRASWGPPAAPAASSAAPWPPPSCCRCWILIRIVLVTWRVQARASPSFIVAAQILHRFCTHSSLVCVCSGSDAGWEYWRLVTTTCTIYTQTPLQPSSSSSSSTSIDTCTTWTRYLVSSQWKSTLRSHFWWLIVVCISNTQTKTPHHKMHL